MALKNLHQFFYYHNKYLNSMKYREIGMDPSIHIIQCTISRDGIALSWMNMHIWMNK